MSIERHPPDGGLALARLLQLASPALPVGSFAYSQGLEWAVQAGWVRDERTLERWVAASLPHTIMMVDVPLLARLYRCREAGDHSGWRRWAAVLQASRETAELRAEERARGQAFAQALAAMGVDGGSEDQAGPLTSFAGGFALAAVHFGIALPSAAVGYVWAWLENAVIAGVKLVPLGQSAGQRILVRLGPVVADVAESGLAVADDDIGGAVAAVAIASSLHETQYTRLFRS